ncbi:MAG: ComEC/Rec2 family competence protein, partial [Chloroflexota bacterium]
MLIYLSGAWVAGIWLGSPLDLPVALILAGLIPLPLLFFGKHRRRIVLASLCLLAFLGGAARFTSSLPPATPDWLQYYRDQGTVTVTGTVADNPEVGDNTVQFQLATTEIIRDGQPRPVSGTALLVVPRYPAYHYGDTIRVTGELQTPPLLGGFDYAAYLARQGISATMYYPGVTLLGTGGGSRPLAWLYRLRERLGLALASVLPEPAAALAQGMVLGIRGNIPNTLQTSFSRTGTAHLLAISGLHLGILAGIMLSLGLWLLGRRHYLYVWLTLGAIWLYAVITGLHPPVVRAAIMATMFLAAELAGRPRRATTALAFAAAVMVGLNPPVLWAVSFQMSFLAMAGLIFIAPPLMARGRRLVSAVLGNEGALVPAARFATDSLSVTLGAVIAVWPLVADYFGVVSLVGPLATFLALPALPGIIVTGALTGAIGLVALPAAQVVGWLAWLCLAYLQLVVNGLAALPLSSLEVTSVSPMLLWAYYAGLALALGLGYHWRQAGRLTRQLTAGIGSGAGNLTRPVSRLPLKWALPPLLAAAVLVTATAATMPDDRLHLSFIDVGQGDAILIQTPAHQDILVDGGGSPQAISLGLGRQMPFW